MIILAPTQDKDRRCNNCGYDEDIYELNVDGTVLALCPLCCIKIADMLSSIGKNIAIKAIKEESE